MAESRGGDIPCWSGDRANQQARQAYASDAERRQAVVAACRERLTGLLEEQAEHEGEETVADRLLRRLEEAVRRPMGDTLVSMFEEINRAQGKARQGGARYWRYVRVTWCTGVRRR